MEIIHNFRFQIFLGEITAGLLGVWLLAFIISLVQRESWQRNKEFIVENGAYTCWIIAFLVHLFVTGIVNGWILVRDNSGSMQPIFEYWPFLILFLSVLVFDAICLIILFRKKSALADLV